MFDFGILWLNARNLLYIKKFNPRRGIHLADDKYKTKMYLLNRWIPSAKFYAMIWSRKELADFDFACLPSRDFVIKPNKWSKWRWIYVTKLINNSLLEKNPEEDICIFNTLDKHNKYWNIFRVNKKTIDQKQLNNYLYDILDGKHSLTSFGDKILIEEKLIPWAGFEKFCQHGLADIRVIVFNLIPIAAMVRVPTKISGGKANLAQWWIGFGMEVGTGRIKHMQFKWQIFSDSFPGEYKDFFNKKLSFWEDILLFSSQIQYFVNLGYLALDWVITADWPKLLEINARAWLEIQKASKVFLKKRLDKLEDMKIKEPEKGVEIAKTLFTKSKANVITNNKILYLTNNAKFIIETKEDESIFTAEIDIKADKNFVSQAVYNRLQEYKGKDIILDLYENEIRFKNPKFFKNPKLSDDKIIIWKDLITDYYIKPLYKVPQIINVLNPSKVVETELENLHILDQKIHSLGRNFTLLNKLKPINYLDELDRFIAHKWNYNPQFEYKYPEIKQILSDREELLNLKRKYFESGMIFKSEFIKIFEEKIEELLIKSQLIEAYTKQDFTNIHKYNILLYWEIQSDLAELCQRELLKPVSWNDFWPEVPLSRVKKLVQNYLIEKWITWVNVVFGHWSSRITVIRKKNIEIVISNLARFREKEIPAILAHEIDVHLVRYINGKKTWWKILESGTGFYSRDEEGLAIYKSFEKLPNGYEKKSLYERYYIIFEAQNKDFVTLGKMFLQEFWYNYISAFRYWFRVKRGTIDTSIIDLGTIFMKDKIYIDGYQNINKFVEKWWDLNKLTIWKIKIQDLNLFV